MRLPLKINFRHTRLKILLYTKYFLKIAEVPCTMEEIYANANQTGENPQTEAEFGYISSYLTVI